MTKRRKAWAFCSIFHLRVFTFNFKRCVRYYLLYVRADQKTSDLVIFKDHFVMTWGDRPPGQLWMMYMLECPVHTQVLDTDRRLGSPRGLGLHAKCDLSNDGLFKFTNANYQQPLWTDSCS
jgi:hypothetical protein